MTENRTDGLTSDWPTDGSHGFRTGYLDGNYSGAERLADDLRSRFQSDVASRVMLLTVVQERKWKFARERFVFDPTTLRACLVPMLTGGFTLLVNDQYTYGERDGVVETAFLAHELSHAVVFYDSTTIPPRRRVRHTVQEEKFCDTFAKSMTGVCLDEAIKEFSVRRVK